MTDLPHMRHALALAERALGTTAPNPAVGCVIVAEGRVVGRGWTQRGGRPHAEAMALARSGRGGAWCDGLCDAGAMRPSGADAALRECADRRRCRARGCGGGGSRSACQRQGARDAACRRHRGRDRRPRKGSGRSQRRILPARDGEPPAGHAQDRAEPRRQDGDGLGPEQMDHRARGAPLRSSAAREERCDPDRHRNRARRRSGAHLPPCRVWKTARRSAWCSTRGCA